MKLAFKVVFALQVFYMPMKKALKKLLRIPKGPSRSKDPRRSEFTRTSCSDFALAL